MRNSVLISAALLALPLAACDKADAPEPAAQKREQAVEAQTPPVAAEGGMQSHRFQSWAGRWTGVEGMFLTITPSPQGGTYDLEMQSDLDTTGRYIGTDSEHGIQFTRDGEKLSLRRASGDETELKYLAGKNECLMVKSGEGYCRD